MDDLDRMLYRVLSPDNLNKMISDLKEKRKFATNDEKSDIDLQIANIEELLNYGNLKE